MENNDSSKGVSLACQEKPSDYQTPINHQVWGSAPHLKDLPTCCNNAYSPHDSRTTKSRDTVTVARIQSGNICYLRRFSGTVVVFHCQRNQLSLSNISSTPNKRLFSGSFDGVFRYFFGMGWWGWCYRWDGVLDYNYKIILYYSTAKQLWQQCDLHFWGRQTHTLTDFHSWRGQGGHFLIGKNDIGSGSCGEPWAVDMRNEKAIRMTWPNFTEKRIKRPRLNVLDHSECWPTFDS